MHCDGAWGAGPRSQCCDRASDGASDNDMKCMHGARVVTKRRSMHGAQVRNGRSYHVAPVPVKGPWWLQLVGGGAKLVS